MSIVLVRITIGNTETSGVIQMTYEKLDRVDAGAKRHEVNRSNVAKGLLYGAWSAHQQLHKREDHSL
jgi:hypothetical protein